MIFGLPVLALQVLGPKLGGPESARWIGLFQLLLAGWVMYIGAVGLFAEAMLEEPIRRHCSKTAFGAAVGFFSIGFYVIGVMCWVMVMFAKLKVLPAAFAVAVSLPTVWSGIQWLRLARRVAKS